MNYLLRRLVFVPLVCVMAVLALVLTAVAAVVSPLLLLRGRWPRWRFLRVATAASVYLLCEVAAVVACLLLWVASIIGKRRWYLRAHRYVLAAFLSVILRTFRFCFGFRVAMEEPRKGAIGTAPVVVLARHAGPGASFALVHQLISRYHRHVRVVLSAKLRLDPAIDLLLTRTGCTWIAPSTMADAAARVGAAAAGLTEREALLLFPEGADWTPLRRLQAVAKLRRQGLYDEARAALRMPHVLPPRPAGTLAALSNAHHAQVLVFTHAGHDRLLDAGSSWRALPLQKPLTMTWWQAPADELPADNEDAVATWLHDVWHDIDAWIDEQEQLRA